MEESSSTFRREGKGAPTSRLRNEEAAAPQGDSMPTSLLESLQGVIERTYDLDTGVRDIGRFVIGDAGYRFLYAGVEREGRLFQRVEPVRSAGTGVLSGEPAGAGARTLL